MSCYGGFGVKMVPESAPGIRAAAKKKKSTFGAVSVSSERIFHEYRQFDS